MNDNLIRDLGNGLIIRYATKADADALSQFNREVHAEDEWDGKGLEDWTLDLVSGESPTVKAKDITIVEDSQTGEIVSSCCLISQTWSYEGIPFKVGRPELVGTKKEYRQRGLVRHQFEILHDWSAERGELVQAITGIPYYYRLFGYEMTLNLGGSRGGYKSHIPTLKEDEQEPYAFRLAGEGDVPFLMDVYEHGCRRNMICAIWDEALWQYELTGKRKYNINRREIYIIEDASGDRAGFIGIPPLIWGPRSVLTVYELAAGYAWPDVTPSVIRFLWQKGEELSKEQGTTLEMVGLGLGETHPAYDVIESRLPNVQKPYAFYIRLTDLPAFLSAITPVLKDRLSKSAFAYYSGEIKLNFYKNGLSLVFKNGRMEDVKSLEFGELEPADASFPHLTFLHLLFGYRSMEELDQMHADCFPKNGESKNLLNVLFPKKPSNVWEIS